MSKILVLTGATGKSGGAFVQTMEEHREEIAGMYPDGIRAIVRESSNTKDMDLRMPEIEKVVGNLTDEATLTKAFENADTVLHIAGIHWSRLIAKAAAKCHVRRLVLVHTTGIYSKYKAAGEEYRQIDADVYKICRENNIVLTILRPTMIYGNTSDRNVVTFIKMVDKLPLTPVVNGARYELQPVHYEDLAEAYFQVLTHEETTANKDFNLSGGAPILLRDMLLEIGRNLGKKVRFISLPFFLAYAGAWVIYGISLTRIDLREKIQRLCEPRVFFYEEARQAFGYTPRTFPEGIKNEVKQYKEQNK